MNNNEVEVKATNFLVEIEDTNKMCKLLLQTPYYKTIGEAGVFAIIQTAKSLGINPIQALQGGLYYFKGKIEMSARMMGALIRSRGHSFTISKIDNTTCTINGKRADTHDAMAASFSIDEAKKARIYVNSWITYPQDMLYARALSRLARRLFPDVVGNCYIEGEINVAKVVDDVNSVEETSTIEKKDVRTTEEVHALNDVFNVIPEYKKEIELFLRKKEILSFQDMPKEMYSKVLKRAKEKIKVYMNSLKDKYSNDDIMEAANV